MYAVMFYAIMIMDLESCQLALEENYMDARALTLLEKCNVQKVALISAEWSTECTLQRSFRKKGLSSYNFQAQSS